jgi:hypothetical protein
MYTYIYIYGMVSKIFWTGADIYRAVVVSITRDLPRPEEKVGKLKKYTVRTFHNVHQARTGPQHGVIQQPKRAQYLIHLSLSPYSHFPAELATILLLAFSLFVLVAALPQCLCSESSYLSIKLDHIYVCYTNIMLYIAFGIIGSFT